MVDRLVNSDVNKRRIETVESAFGISGSKLAVPGRVLVGEGVLTKICRKKPKPRQFFLFNDLLVYGTILINKKKYAHQHLIALEGVTLQDVEDSKGIDNKELANGWLIKTPNKSFAVYAATNTEKIEWMAHLQKSIDDLIRTTGKQPTGSHAAVWIPDSNTKVCMQCHTGFTLMNRRHHCRSCGACICGNCSANKFLLPAQSSKPLRVCNNCFARLCEGRVPSSEPTTPTSPSKPPVLAPPAFTPPVVAPPIPEAATNRDSVEGDGVPVKTTDDDSSDDDDPSASSGEQLAEGVNDIVLDNKPTFYSTPAVEEETNGVIPVAEKETSPEPRRAAPPPPSTPVPSSDEPAAN